MVELAHQAPQRVRLGDGMHVILAVAAAVGAGLSAAVDVVTHRGHLSGVAATVAVVAPVTAYTIMVFLLRGRQPAEGR